MDTVKNLKNPGEEYEDGEWGWASGTSTGNAHSGWESPESSGMLANTFRGEEESFHPKDNPGWQIFEYCSKMTICKHKKKKSNHSLLCACHCEHTRTLYLSVKSPCVLQCELIIPPNGTHKK